MIADDRCQSIRGLVSDEELMRRVVSREQGALGLLYGRHSLLLREIIADTLCNACDTEEALQDVFIAIWNCAGNYDPAAGNRWAGSFAWRAGAR